MTGVATRFAIYFFRRQDLLIVEPIRVGQTRAEDVAWRADELLRISVAVEAPLHVERVFSPHQRHLVDRSVACRAGHAFVNVNAVIEIDEVRQIMHARPLNRLAGLRTLAHGGQNCAVCKELRVTIHADASSRNAGERRLLDARVAIAAIQADISHMMLVAERNWLFAHHAYFSGIGRTNQDQQQAKAGRSQKERAENTDPGHGVHRGMKELRHETPLEAQQLQRNDRPLRINVRARRAH